MGPISFYLGLKVEWDQVKQTIKLLQPAYIDKVLAKFYLNKAHAVNISMKKTVLLQLRTEGQVTTSEREWYQDITSSIIFSMVEIKPDIVFATSIVSYFAKIPGHQYIEVVKTILQYLKGSRKWEILYGGQEELLVKGYSDSDWVSNKKSRKSTSDFIFMLNKGLVSWCSKKQATVALLSIKAKYITLTLAAKETTWL